MFPTVFHIPEQVAGVPLFGAGLLLVVWAVASVALLAWLVRRQGWCADTLGYVPLLLLLGALILWILPLISEPGLGLPIRSYGVMLFLAVFAGTTLTIWRGGRLGLDADWVLTLAIWGFIPGILMARLFYVVRYFWSEFYRPTVGATLVEIINITQGGLIVYGALIGGLLGFGALIVWRRLPALATLDLVVPGMLLGLALGRIGCFLFGCCYGGPSNLLWAVRFPFGSPPFLQEVQQGEIFLYGLKILGEPSDPPVIAAVEPGSEAERQGLRAGMHVRTIGGFPALSVQHAQTLLLQAHRVGPQVEVATSELAGVVRLSIPSPLPRSRPLHPTQLYSALDAAILCLFLLAYDTFRRRDGELLALALTIYPINRFLMEFIRTDDPGVWGTWLKLGQVFSLMFLAVAAGLWWHILRRPPGKAFPLATDGSGR
jgi:phosphatidylglycerol:prolipoprotein diacylglycerol transferase